MTPELRDKDIAVLEAIRDGANDVHEIGEATTLTNREINYSITEYSLEDLGLVDVDRPDGREWREVDSREMEVWTPKQVALTDAGIQYLAQHDSEEHGYEDFSKRELVQRIEDLEERQDRLETLFKRFRDKVMDRF
jgi:hypothetical protein